MNFMRLVVCGVDKPAFQRDGGRVLKRELDGRGDMVHGTRVKNERTLDVSRGTCSGRRQLGGSV